MVVLSLLMIMTLWWLMLQFKFVCMMCGMLCMMWLCVDCVVVDDDDGVKYGLVLIKCDV